VEGRNKRDKQTGQKYRKKENKGGKGAGKDRDRRTLI